MAGLLAYAAAGALSGLGKGMVEEANNRREDAIRAEAAARAEANHQRDRGEKLQDLQSTRTYEAGQKAEDRKYRSSERDEDRAYQAKRDEINFNQSLTLEEKRAEQRRVDEEAKAARDNAEVGGTVTGEDGTVYQRNKGAKPSDPYTPAIGPDGKPIRERAKSRYSTTGTSNPDDPDAEPAMSPSERRLRIKEAMDMGVDPNSVSGGRDWRKVVAQLRTQGLSPKSVMADVQADMEIRAEKLKLDGAQKDQFVAQQMAKLGLMPSTSSPGVTGNGGAGEPTPGPTTPGKPAPADPSAPPAPITRQQQDDSVQAGETPPMAGAKYSPSHKAWFVYQDGKWFRVDAKRGSNGR